MKNLTFAYFSETLYGFPNVDIKRLCPVAGKSLKKLLFPAVCFRAVGVLSSTTTCNIAIGVKEMKV